MDGSKIRSYIKQLSHYDNQERYMGLNDLGRELVKEGPLPEHLERTICEAVLSKLDDPSTDVQSIAVKTLALLLKKVGHNELCMIGFETIFSFFSFVYVYVCVCFFLLSCVFLFLSLETNSWTLCSTGPKISSTFMRLVSKP